MQNGKSNWLQIKIYNPTATNQTTCKGRQMNFNREAASSHLP